MGDFGSGPGCGDGKSGIRQRGMVAATAALGERRQRVMGSTGGVEWVATAAALGERR